MNTIRSSPSTNHDLL